MNENSKWGLFVGGMKVKEYENDEYEQALKDLRHVYDVLGTPHELKLITT